MELKPWTIQSSRQVLKDRWIDVRADDCVTSEGHSISPYYVLSYPDWVHVVAIGDDSSVLLLEQYRHGLGIVSLEVPGGGIDAGETPLEAGKRELLEETGFEARHWQYCGRLAPNPAMQTNYSHIVLATELMESQAPMNDPSERVVLRQLPLTEAVNKALTGGICQAIHTSALLLALAHGNLVKITAEARDQWKRQARLTVDHL
ncbi:MULTISPECIES: NUDIX hydrolase [unclassified Rhizobium]|uniref:NUDIX hydrolase n=1 Tax=unclassified Rhizobium TaxID=2613769 RepID=UPI00160B979F|nr:MULTISPECIES: NUDIX hydrolase [unclassified Rhizobium]MBB3287162.1 8-oxo-dGTP pyrophosphatase MutT (NUDIX family) [Rhizobium sp. BK252]MBB3401902.1 8-oxo-dGTP pyrophosphatase MutT (NUDIX family) [Rhizobium sp. BK289]MBB3414154.1 8-oxo-dGTP pyrophosphatase MutT (NUDIX family) [Rhizobium sp. BK284]MBB3482041.1 8-oxo-dGTP pyrophosphatase MutT (NUDIX family) [Rhizobium sp. BK347]